MRKKSSYYSNVSIPYKYTFNVSIPYKYTFNVSIPYKYTFNVSIPYKYTFNVYNCQDITEILLKVVLNTIEKSVFIEVLIPCCLTVGMNDMLFSDKETV